MSKPQAIKVSTPQVKMSEFCSKCQYFVWPPLLSSTAVTLLGMEFTRALHEVTGILFHSSMMTLWSRWMLETLRISTFRFRRGFLLGWQPCRPVWCSVRCMVCALQAVPLPFQPLQQCGQHSYVYFQNTASGYDAQHAHSTSLVFWFFGKGLWYFFTSKVVRG